MEKKTCMTKKYSSSNHILLLMLAACRHYWAKIIMPYMRGHRCFVTSFMSKSWFKINQSLWIIDALHIISLNVGFKFSKDRLRLWNSTPCVDWFTWPPGCMDKLPWHDGTLFEPNLPLILNFRDSQDSMRGRFCIPRKPTGCQNIVNNFLDWILSRCGGSNHCKFSHRVGSVSLGFVFGLWVISKILYS